MRRLILVVLFATLAACNQGSPYAFRLMVPPTLNIAKEEWADYLPYWLGWETVATVET